MVRIAQEHGVPSRIVESVIEVNAAQKARMIKKIREALGGNEVLAYLDEFTMRASHSYDETSITAPLVFVGYGITAPRFNHDDYAGMDVKGKIVMVMVNDPGFWAGDKIGRAHV